MERREFLALTGMSAVDLAGKTIWPFIGAADHLAAKSDFSIRIAPVKLELAPGKIVETIGYNGTVPGPVLRMREGKRVTGLISMYAQLYSLPD